MCSFFGSCSFWRATCCSIGLTVNIGILSLFIWQCVARLLSEGRFYICLHVRCTWPLGRSWTLQRYVNLGIIWGNPWVPTAVTGTTGDELFGFSLGIQSVVIAFDGWRTSNLSLMIDGRCWVIPWSVSGFANRLEALERTNEYRDW